MTEQELIHLYVQGQDAAFDTFYLRHKDNLYSYVLSVIGNEHCAEDIASKSWCKFIDKCRFIESNPLAYLYAITRNQIAEYFRSRKVVCELQEDEHEVEYCIESRAEFEGVTIKLDNLPLPQREALLLKHFAGLSIKEIAQLQNINHESAKTRLRYAMSKVRRMLGSVGS